jgi:uncharacterized membrane protein YccC
MSVEEGTAFRGRHMEWTRFEARQLRGAVVFAFRLSAAALLALFLAYRLGVTLPLWAALTALIVTQISLGRSLKATLDYFAATIGGVLWGGFIAVLVPHASETSVLFVLFLAIAPMAFAAALYPRLTVAPVTATIVVLVPQMLHTTPIASGIDRIIEVFLGGLTGLLVSFVLVPWSAFQHTREIAAQVLRNMSRAIPELIAGFEHGLSDLEAHRIQDGIGQLLGELSSVIAEAERERPLRLASADPLTGPLFRTLLRLRHDLVILGRAAQSPLAASVNIALQPLLMVIAAETKLYLESSAAALLSKQTPPPLEAFELALTGYDAQIDASRQAGALRDLSSDDAERLFAVSFALEQMHRNFQDLERCVEEWAARRE